MTGLRRLLEHHVGDGSLPGAVAAVARGDDVEVVAAGSVDLDGTAPMTRDSIFRIASVTEPVTVFDVLTGQAGWVFPSDFDPPAARAPAAVQKDGREVRSFPPAGEWVAALARVPVLHRPGDSWLYDTCSRCRSPGGTGSRASAGQAVRCCPARRCG